MKPRLFDIINTFDKTSSMLNERAKTNVDLRVAMTETTKENSVSVQQYEIEVVQQQFAGKRKNFYNIYEHNKLIYQDIALFETAMGVVKNLMQGKSNKVENLLKYDLDYNNALYEVYMYKTKVKRAVNEDVMIAKLSSAKQRLQEVKLKILRRL